MDGDGDGVKALGRDQAGLPIGISAVVLRAEVVALGMMDEVSEEFGCGGGEATERLVGEEDGGVAVAAVVGVFGAHLFLEVWEGRGESGTVGVWGDVGFTGVGADWADHLDLDLVMFGVVFVGAKEGDVGVFDE